MRALLALVLVGCSVPFGEEPAPPLRYGEMEERVAQEHCYRWICPVGYVGVKRVSCGGLDEYDCR